MKTLMGVFAMLVVASPLISFGADDDAKCKSDVPIHLNWCSSDTGYNEGAVCGANALAGVAGIQIPNQAQGALGNLWHRDAMMQATIQAWKAGAKDQAVDAAVCCQVHNDGAHQCLSSHRDQVKDWLRTK